MNLGVGSLHSQGSLSGAINTSLLPSSLTQGLIGSGLSHVSMQQTAQSRLPTTSMSITGPGHSPPGPTSQGVPMQGQGTICNYVSRTKISM
ncbi:hypothetical protein H8958_007618 [Nasalis larvatus]